MGAADRTALDSVAFYDRLWARTRRVDQHHRCRMLAIERLLAHARLPARPRILEPGCGSGMVTEMLARHGEVTALDQSPLGLEKGRTRVAARFLLATLPTLPEALESDFDLCVLSQVLEHFNDPEQRLLLRNLREKTRDGGFLIVTTPNRAVSSRMRFAPGELEPIENWLDPAALERLLAATGWRVERIAFAFNFFPVLASRYRPARAARYLVYDVLHLRALCEAVTASWGTGDCTVALALKAPR